MKLAAVSLSALLLPGLSPPPSDPKDSKLPPIDTHPIADRRALARSKRIKDQGIASRAMALEFHGDHYYMYSGAYCMDPETFVYLMEWLRDNDVWAMNAEELVGFINGTMDMPARSIILTTDSGNTSKDSLARMVPVLQETGLHFISFIWTRQMLGSEHERCANDSCWEAFRVARDYASTRKQFAVAIEKLPAVRDMLIDMKIAIEAGRALLYETSRVVDMELGYARQLETNPPEDKAQAKQLKNESRKYKRYASMLTPMSKYYCSEMCNSVTYDSIQVLGGSGYMRDYPCERYARDARITTIYEGTSQLQVVAAVRGVCSGTAEKFITEMAGEDFDEKVQDLLETLAVGTEQLKESIAYVKEQGNEYMDLYGRALVDIAIDLINGYLFCGQASTKVDMQVPVAENGQAGNGQTISMKERKAAVARRYVTRNAPKIAALAELIRTGDKSTFNDYEAMVGPVPVE